MIIWSILFASALGASPQEAARLTKPEQELVELLRDCQATNLNHYRSGVMTATLEHRDEIKGTSAKLDVETSWNKGDSIWRWRGDESGGVPDASLTEEEKRLWETRETKIMVKDNSIYGYTKFSGDVYKHDFTALPGLLGEFKVYPNWFRCCPPTSGGGRPWSELIGLHPAMPQDGLKGIRVTRVGSRVTHQRIADDITTRITFALDQGGNVVELAGEPHGEGVRTRKGSYRWKKGAGGVFLLEGYDFEQFGSGRSGRVHMTDKLVVTKLVLEETPVTLSRFMGTLPPGTKIVDQSHKARPAKADSALDAKPDEKDFAKDAELLKRKGFLRRNR